MYLDSVIRGIPISSPVISWLFRGIGNPRNGLHVLQPKLYGYQETEGCSMFHRESLTAEVCDKQRLRMACRCQVDRDEIGIRVTRGIEIDRRLYTSPFCLRHWRVRTKQIIESQTSPPRDRTPAFDANQPGNLLMDREAIHELPNIERDSQARSKPIQSQIPSRYIARVRSGSVVVVLDRANLGFCVDGHHTISGVQCFTYIIVNTQCFVQEPLLPTRVHILTHTHATERSLWQKNY